MRFYIVDASTLDLKKKVGRLRVSRHFITWKTSDKCKRVDSTPWCVPTDSMQKRPQLTHEQNLKIEEVVYWKKLALIRNLIFCGN